MKQIKKDIISIFNFCKSTTDVDNLKKEYLDFIEVCCREKKLEIQRDNVKFIQDLVAQKILDHFSYKDFSLQEAIYYSKYIFGNGNVLKYFDTYVFCSAYKAFMKIQLFLYRN